MYVFDYQVDSRVASYRKYATKFVELVTDLICIWHVEIGSEYTLRHLVWLLIVWSKTSKDHRLENF